MPAARPPHKPDRVLASGADRMALLRAACAPDARLRPDDVELAREGVSYSYETACALRERFGEGVGLFYVIGADTLADLPHWRRIRELAALVTFCPVSRPGWTLALAPLRQVVEARDLARIRDHVVEVEPHPASSTAIREALAAGRRPAGLPDAVYDEIVARGLYGVPPSGSDPTPGTSSASQSGASSSDRSTGDS